MQCRASGLNGIYLLGVILTAAWFDQQMFQLVLLLLLLLLCCCSPAGAHGSLRCRQEHLHGHSCHAQVRGANLRSLAAVWQTSNKQLDQADSLCATGAVV